MHRSTHICTLRPISPKGNLLGEEAPTRIAQISTHGNEMMLYRMPNLVPICHIFEICATHGVTSEINAPEKNPYSEENSITETKDFANNQTTTQESPEKNAEGMRRLNRPMLSEIQAGAILPSTPPAFMTANT